MKKIILTWLAITATFLALVWNHPYPADVSKVAVLVACAVGYKYHRLSWCVEKYFKEKKQ